MSCVVVWPDKFRAGWERGSNPPETSTGSPLETFDVVEIKAALRRVYDSDAHFVPYRIEGLDQCPRINAGGLVELNRAGRDVVFDVIPIDIDAPAGVQVEQ